MLASFFRQVVQSFKKDSDQRGALLDIYRGVAVFLMIIFHFCWDLRAYGYMEFSLKAPFWVHFRELIMFLFISAVGWSAYLMYQNGIQWRRFMQRQGKLLLCAAAISAGSYLAFPHNWIFFGIIHFIFIASLLVAPLASKPKISFALGICLMIIYLTSNDIQNFNLHHTLVKHFSLPHYTLDFVHPALWTAIVFLGPMLGYLGLHQYPVPRYAALNWFAFLGRYALSIYLVHQVVIYGLIGLFAYLISFF